MADKQILGDNVSVEVQGDRIIATVDTSIDLGASKSGKTKLVGSSRGNKTIMVKGKPVKFSVNAYRE